MTQTPLSANRPLLEPDGTMTKETRTFMNAVARLFPLTGTGSPEGIQEARATRFYIDLAGTTGSILWVKQVDILAGDNKSGWILT